MANSGLTSIYINVKPKRWRVTHSYRALKALQNLSDYNELGDTSAGVHEGIGTRINFVLHVIFASQEEKETYEQNESYKYFLRKLKRYSMRGGFKLITN